LRAPDCLQCPHEPLRAAWLRLKPDPSNVPAAEQLRSALAVAAGVLTTAGLSAWLLHSPPLLVAAVGASAVILLVLPPVRWRSRGRWSAAIWFAPRQASSARRRCRTWRWRRRWRSGWPPWHAAAALPASAGGAVALFA